MATGSIRIKKTKDGKVRYQITVEGERDPLTGKRNRIYKNVDGSKKEANAVMRQMITEMESGKVVKKCDLTVAEWMAEWISLYLPNIEETTRVGYKTKLKCYIIPAIGEIRIHALRAEHVQKLVNDMIARNLSPKNIRDTFNNINAAMKKAVVLRYIAYNPCEGVVLPKQKKYRAKVYNQALIHTLLDVTRGTDMYLPVLLCVAVGLRRGELLALRWEHIDFENKILKVRSNTVRGEKGYIIKAPKSEAGIRDISLGDEIVHELRKARAQYARDTFAYGVGFQNHGYVIKQPNGAPYKPDSMTQKWERLLEKNNLPKIRLHDLRHPYVKNLTKNFIGKSTLQMSGIRHLRGRFSHLVIQKGLSPCR